MKPSRPTLLARLTQQLAAHPLDGLLVTLPLAVGSHHRYEDWKMQNCEWDDLLKLLDKTHSKYEHHPPFEHLDDRQHD